MGLSSNSLIHLTKNKNSLMGILQEEFKIKYCLETIRTSKGPFTAAVPMVSFCDIPLSEIKNHIKSYGEYGIGLKKVWAKRKGLNPVLYLDSNSTLGGDFLNAAKEILSGKKFSTYTETETAIGDLLRYMKNYEGELLRDGLTISDYRFSDEREWRYVPNRKVASMAIGLKEYDTVEKKEKANSLLGTLSLGFEPNDIAYIIIKNESEISEFIQSLEDAKGKKYPFHDVKRLTTRIITTDQILNDF